MKKVAVVSLGCSKNLVDAERLMGMMKKNGCEVFFFDGYAQLPERFTRRHPLDAVVVNTCGFISDAKEESIEEILSWTFAKESGLVREVIVMGCLSQRYRESLPAEIPEVDAWYGKTDWAAIAERLGEGTPACSGTDRMISTPAHYAYLKIAEGCNRRCAFCAIPHITGPYRSRTIEDITEEVRSLVARGVKELNVIAQDLTYYGRDIYGAPSIARLVDAIAAVEGVEWIRLHYAYPNDFPLDLLDAINRNKNVCKYLDIALQHSADRVLENMNRHITGEETASLLREIRRRVPGIHLRTTLMVGFPGEGEEEFEDLLRFTKEQQFERMGAFAYCEEEDTLAARTLADEVPQEVKEHRLDKLMALQEEIAHEVNLRKVGSTMRVIIDREEEDYYIGRTEVDSPEVDPEVLVAKDKPLTAGEFYDVLITDALPYELYGKPV